VDPYIGEVRIFAGNYPPAGWADCDGSLLPIADNDALFNLVGTTYGGDGQTTFGLPDLQGRVPVHQGQGPGITQNYVMGEQGGAEEVTLVTQQLPVHTHALLASTDAGTNANAQGNALAASPSVQLYTQDVASVQLSSNALTQNGGSVAHENRMPVIAIRYIIALEGIYPPQS
jgi:microcystin-dependent protein